MDEQKNQIGDRARELRNAYYRKWRREHKESVRESTRRYWLRKAEAALAEEKDGGCDESKE